MEMNQSQMFSGENFPRSIHGDTLTPNSKLRWFFLFFCRQVYPCEIGFLRVSPANANKPMLNIVSMAGSGTAAVGAFRLIVAPATFPLPPVGKNVPLSVADNVPVTFGDSAPAPRKLNRAGLILPAMKLAEKAD
jgi:hypothetical protein